MTSDNELRIEMRNEVTRHLGIRADAVDVQVRRGVVTLTGHLQSELEKWALHDALAAIPGVERLHDETMIVPEPSVRSPAADVARPWFPAE